MYEETYHDERELPYFTLRQIDLPEIAKWQVGEEYYLLMKVEMTGVGVRSDLEGKEEKKKMEGQFKVKSVGAVDSQPVDLKAIEKRDFEQKVAKIKSGEY
jgi:hypothetical protein